MFPVEFDPAIPAIKRSQIHASFLLRLNSSFPQKFRWNIEQALREWIYVEEFWGYTGTLQEWPVIKKEGMRKAENFCSKCK